LNKSSEQYEAVIETEAVLEPRLIGSAHFMIGRLQRRTAHRSPEQFVALHQAGQADVELVETTLLESAHAHLSEAVQFSRSDHDPIRRGHTLSEASAAAQDLGVDDEAIPLVEEAFRLLTPRRLVHTGRCLWALPGVRLRTPPRKSGRKPHLEYAALDDRGDFCRAGIL
jgi:hypothetical protein